MNMRWSRIVCLFALSVVSPGIARAEPLPIKTVEFDGKCVGRKMKYNIVLPAKYAQRTDRYPVLYLLHGYSSNYTAWARMGVPEYARQFDLIVVMPDGQVATRPEVGDANTSGHLTSGLKFSILFGTTRRILNFNPEVKSPKNPGKIRVRRAAT